VSDRLLMINTKRSSLLDSHFKSPGGRNFIACTLFYDKGN
jgi:hypothetical protein